MPEPEKFMIVQPTPDQFWEDEFGNDLVTFNVEEAVEVSAEGIVEAVHSVARSQAIYIPDAIKSATEFDAVIAEAVRRVLRGEKRGE